MCILVSRIMQHLEYDNITNMTTSHTYLILSFTIRSKHFVLVKELATSYKLMLIFLTSPRHLIYSN